MKKLLSTVIVIVFVLSSTCQSFAWGGYGHWYMAQDTGSSLSSTKLKYYASGCLLADIGKYQMDTLNTDSDSNTFSKKMVSLANNVDTTAAKYFASGWRAHYIQDTQGDVMNDISGGSTVYRIKCGWIDEYLRDSLGIDCPINGTATLYVNYTLIKNAYSALDNLSLTTSEIDTSITGMYSLYDAQILANTSSWTSAQKKSIKAELAETADACSTLYSANTNSFRGICSSNQDNAQNTINIQPEQKAERITEAKKDIKEKLDEIQENGCWEITKTPGDTEGEYYLSFKIAEPKIYLEKLNEMVEIVDDSGLTFDEVYDIN